MGAPFSALSRAMNKLAAYDVEKDIYEDHPDSALRRAYQAPNRALIETLGAITGALKGTESGKALALKADLSPTAGIAAGGLLGGYSGRALAGAGLDDSARISVKAVREAAEALKREHAAQGDKYDLSADLMSTKDNTELYKKLYDTIPTRNRILGGLLGGAGTAALVHMARAPANVVIPTAVMGAGIGSTVPELPFMRNAHARGTLAPLREAALRLSGEGEG